LPERVLGSTGQGRDHLTTGFRLPPGVNDGATRIADDLVVPLPGLRIIDGALVHCPVALGVDVGILKIAGDGVYRKFRHMGDSDILQRNQNDTWAAMRSNPARELIIKKN
jgi:hypothetical protein